MIEATRARAIGADHKLTDGAPDECLLAPDDHPAVLASDADREWFEQHAGAEKRIRPPTAGEIATLDGAHGCMVVVTQLRPGVRMRSFIPRPSVEGVQP